MFGRIPNERTRSWRLGGEFGSLIGVNSSWQSAMPNFALHDAKSGRGENEEYWFWMVSHCTMRNLENFAEYNAK